MEASNYWKKKKTNDKKDNTICQNFHIRMVKLYSLALGYAIYMNNTNTTFNKLHLMVFKDLIFLRNLRNKT